MERKANAEVLNMIEEWRILLNTTEYRRGNLFGHLIRHDIFFKTTRRNYYVKEGRKEGRYYGRY